MIFRMHDRQPSERTEHGPAGVDQLQLAVAAEGLGVSGQTSSVPAVVTSELAGQVAGGVGGEGTQPLCALRAIPADEIYTK
jgi:hypothetical protein